MSSSKPSGSKTKRKIADEHRNFQEKWELEYFCSEVKDKIICLICNNAISVPKLYNIKRHYEQHKSKESEAAVHASYVLSEMIAKHSKPFTEGDFIKECLIKAAEIVCPGSVKTFQAISLSQNTVVERVTDMARNLNDQIKEKSSCFEAFSIACDESTDIGGVAQLAVSFFFFFRACDTDFNIFEELLELVPMHGTTTGKDIFNCVNDLLQKYNLPKSKLTSVAKDGAPSMTGKTNGFVALLRKKLSEISDGFNIHHTHCIIHQEVLCTKVIKMESVLTPIKKFINFIRSRGLNQRQLSLFLTELESEYSGLSYYTEVRWLSCSKVLKQFWDLKEEICQFLITKNQDITLFSDQVWLQDFSFMVDITKHLSDLNLKLQGKDQIITNMCDQVNAFICKLVLWEKQLKNEDLMHFPTCNMYKSSLANPAYGTEGERYLNYVDAKFSKYANPFVEAGNSMTKPFNVTWGQTNIGFTQPLTTIKNGVRQDTNDAFLAPIRKSRKNLDIITNVFVRKVLIDTSNGTRAYGVEFDIQNILSNLLPFLAGKRCRMTARKEVIVSAGALGSPQVLMHSGIGPRAVLEKAGTTVLVVQIPVIVDLPVGQNLHDHVGTLALNFITDKRNIITNAASELLTLGQFTLSFIQYLFTQEVSQESEAAVHASYVLSEMIAKHSKPFTEGDFIKECLIKAAEIVCPGSVKTFEAISLFRNTVVERVTDMARNLNDQIKEKSSCFEAFSIACDESPDIGGVRWSCSKVLKQFWDLKEEICQFLITKNQDITLFSDQVWLQDFSFMVDITKHLSDLNLKLQGKDQIITNMCDQVNAFKCKLVLWENQLKNEDLLHFLTCNMYKSSLGETASYKKYAEKNLSLRNEFETRFSDFKSLESKFTLFSSIFSINIESDIQCDSDLKAKCIEVGVSEFYKYLPARFENTRKLAYEIMSMFGSTYRCEQLFSLMKGNKPPIRSRITDVHLGSVLKLITANKISPEVGKMVAEKRCQISGRKY
ncbi:hypothetical protein LAZ67_21000070 [Cordylochernes scorpioides]|uniref:Glucose-methanol-choline oxidoreductase N-terminal domain-containing protein n=1 Tax=Cordylochernes scorpioides TaxID=51811 RepID=A0ABY6LPW2_9ARAC|nr:hypothetical protein LAZ67_21000070 [Cordylochernes scorpioides]